MSRTRNVNSQELIIIKNILSKSLDEEVLNRQIKLKEGYDDVNAKISLTRSSAIIIDNLVWHDPSNNNQNSIFIKITPNANDEEKSVSMSEIEIYDVTSKAMDYSLSRHFLKCYNEKLVRNNHVNDSMNILIDGQLRNFRSFTILIIENTGNHSVPLADMTGRLKYMERRSNDNSLSNAQRERFRIEANGLQYKLNILMLQVIHTLYVFNILGIKHLDLHYNNIRVVPSERGMYVNRYTISRNKNTLTQGVSSSRSMYLPNCGYEIKIIDYDGATKMNRSSMIDPKYPPVFKKGIPNTYGTKNYKNVKNTYLQDFYKFLSEAPKHFMEKYAHLLKTRRNNIDSLFTATPENKRRIFESGSNNSRLSINERARIRELQTNYHYFIKTNGSDIINENLLDSPMKFLLNLVDIDYNTVPSGFTVRQYINNALYYYPSSSTMRSGRASSVSASIPRFDYNEFIRFQRNMGTTVNRMNIDQNETVNMMNVNNNNRVRNNLAQRLRNHLRIIR